MDWSSLSKLDLGSTSPRHLFAILTNRLPSLTYLKFGIEASSSLHPLDTGLSILSAFIASVPTLAESGFRAWTYEDFAAALPVILTHQGTRLRRLKIFCKAYNMNAWEVNQYVQVLEEAPRLEYMRAEIKEGVLEGTWEGQQRGLSARLKFETALKNDRVAGDSKVKECRKKGKMSGK
jgi:hypothetical protein